MNLKTITYDVADVTATLDLINYNFDQLLANGYGPQGIAGNVGGTGSAGVQGAAGLQGDVGSAGAAGPNGAVSGVEWVNDTTTVSGTNIMIPKNIAGVTSLTTVSIGEDSITSNNEGSQLFVGRNSVDFDSNIRLTVPGSTNYLEFIQDVSTLNISFNSSATSTLFKISGDTIKFSDSSDNDEFASFSATEISFKKDVSFDATVQFNDTLKLGINGSATAGDVLVAANNNGLLEWKSPSTLGANVPIGTVVPILSSLYNATNFTKTSAYTSASDFTTVAGTGIAGTEYEGWYLCHGYTWFNLSADVAYTPPNVSGKKFTNASSAVLQDTDDTILSGARLSVVANTSGGTNIETSIDTTPISKKLGDSGTAIFGHTDFNVIKLPHIIYLGTTNTLSWRFVDVSSLTSYTPYYIDAPESAHTTMCTEFQGTTNVYADKVTVTFYQGFNSGSDTAFKHITNDSNSRIYVDDGVLAPAGWYMEFGLFGGREFDYWNGTEWSATSYSVCDMS